MTTGAAIRGIRLWKWRRIRHLPDFDGAAEIRRFSQGVLVHAVGFASLPLLFFNDLSQSERAAVAIMLSAMASGSVSVLAPALRLAISYAILLVVPTAVMFLLTSGTENAILGFLAICFCCLLVHSAGISHRAALSAIRVNSANAHLVREMQQANAELSSAQEQLRLVNATLESRIHARTRDLEREIGERARYAQQLAIAASEDSLTGLSNRNSFTTRLGAELLHAGHCGQIVAVLFIDLDKFKEVNDVRGHEAGDQVLREIARRLQDRLQTHCQRLGLPDQAEIARWGGDEFVVMLPELRREEDALRAARELRESIRGPVDLPPEAVKIDCTIGIALFPEHGRTEDDLIRAADVAMYAGKQDGRNKIRLFMKELGDALFKRHTLAQALHEAVDSESLSLCYQPIVSIENGECGVMEALLRWNHPELGWVPPLDFIPIAERSGDIIAIGRWVLMEACKAAAGWPGPTPPAVSVNVSAVQVLSGTLFDDVNVALLRAGLPSSRLHIELTESLFAGDTERVSLMLESLRGMGVRISIDDFGTGFSSLSYLQSLPIDTIKIDRSFVSRLDSDSLAIVTAIISIANTLNFEVIAEGVETEAQGESLRLLGVRQFQGFLLGRPMKPEAVADWLRESRASALRLWSLARQRSREDLLALDRAQREAMALRNPVLAPAKDKDLR